MIRNFAVTPFPVYTGFKAAGWQVSPNPIVSPNGQEVMFDLDGNVPFTESQEREILYSGGRLIPASDVNNWLVSNNWRIPSDEA